MSKPIQRKDIHTFRILYFSYFQYYSIINDALTGIYLNGMVVHFSVTNDKNPTKFRQIFIFNHHANNRFLLLINYIQNWI